MKERKHETRQKNQGKRRRKSKSQKIARGEPEERQQARQEKCRSKTNGKATFSATGPRGELAGGRPRRDRLRGFRLKR